MEPKKSVEAVLIYQNQVLLVKRADDCKIAPGVWNVPAGKVKEKEEPALAVVREMEEETQIKTHVVRLLAENTFPMSDGSLRNMFTYLVAVSSSPIVTLDREHSTYCWVTAEELESKEYSSLMPRLKEIISRTMQGNR